MLHFICAAFNCVQTWEWEHGVASHPYLAQSRAGALLSHYLIHSGEEEVEGGASGAARRSSWAFWWWRWF